MQWGSVRFFKRLILLTILLMILIPTGLSIFFAVKITHLDAEVSSKEVAAAGIRSVSAMEPSANSLPYQTLYPELCAQPAKELENTVGKVYLTFDDGPSSLTYGVLDTLKVKNVKATFFVVGSKLESEEGKALLKRIVAEGHTVGIHTYSHNYRDIYASVDSYLEDFNKTYEAIYNIAGVKVSVFRFPGGSVNGYNAHIYQEIIAEMSRRGFAYYDWNVSAQDAVSGNKATSQGIVNTVVSRTKTCSRAIVLMHDSATKTSTAQALPMMIDQLAAAGYTFAPLTSAVEPIMFGYGE